MRPFNYLRQIIVTLTLIVISGVAFGQNKEVEIAKTLRNTPQVDHDSIYYEFFKVYMFDDYVKARDYALNSYRLAKSSNHYMRLAKSCRALAYSYSKLNLLDSASIYYSRGIDVCRKKKLGMVLIYLYNDFGIHFERQDVYDSALRYYNLALEESVKMGSVDDEAIALNNMGLIFYYLFNFDEALENLNEAVEINRKNQSQERLMLNLLNIALIYNDQSLYDKAIKRLEEVENYCKNDCGMEVKTSLSYNLALAYNGTENYGEALSYFSQAYELSKAMNDNKKMASCLYYFAQFKIRNKDFMGSLTDLREAEHIAQSVNSKRLKRDIYGAFKEVYSSLGKLDKVVDYQKKYMLMKDSIFNEQLARNLKDIQLDAQRKQSEVIIQQKDTEIERVRLITLLVGVISILLVAVSILTYRNYRASHRMKTVLEKEIKKRTSELVKSNTDLTQMTQEYDQLVYRASHDIRGPLATLMGLTNIAKQDYEEPMRVRDYLGKIESTAHGLNQTLSQLMETNRIRNLPICIEEVDMGALVDQTYGSFKTLNHFPLISLRIERGDWKNPLQSDKNLIAFVLTKLLDNAFRYFATHKQEKYIKVSWSQSDDKTIIAVEDNGLGIDDKAKEKIFQLFYVASDVHGSGLGLFLAQMAANRLGGRIILARSSGPTIFKLVISTNLAQAQLENKPVMTVAS